MNVIIPSHRRAGFTLVEVLVVTGILAILFALATGVAIRALITAEEARVTAEMRQLESAITSFKTKYGVSYLPSRFRLRATLAGYSATDPFEKSCRDYLTTMFPRMKADEVIYWYPQAAPTNWTNNSVMELNGPECLVFFLGGWNGLDGFSKNPLDPSTAPKTAATAASAARPTGLRGDVSFEFDTRRLKAGVFCQRTPSGSGSIGSTTPSNAYVYLDGFGNGATDDQPYYYFTSYKSGDDYKIDDAIAIPSPSYQLPTGSTMNSLLPMKIGPHQDDKGRFYNPKGFQLVSAGRDKRLTNLTLASGSSANNGYAVWKVNGTFVTGTVNYTDSIDNLCNFHPAKMGIPQ